MAHFALPSGDILTKCDHCQAQLPKQEKVDAASVAGLIDFDGGGNYKGEEGLASLPRVLDVQGSLDLSDCAGPVLLPRKLFVTGNLVFPWFSGY